MIKKRKLSPSLIVGITLAIAVWVIFYPGILSADSLYTYNEAITGRFTDIRPPFIALMLFVLFKAGGTLGLFILLESLLGFLGVRRLLLAITDWFFVQRKKRELVASVGILILSSPLTPMPIYFVTLWFDSWLAIFLLWTIAFMLELSRDVAKPISQKDYPKIFAVLSLISLVMLTRWNSLLLYLPLILIWITILWARLFSRRILLALAFSPLIIYFLFLGFQYNVVGVRRVHAERMPFAVDLASMITYAPSICRTLSLQSCGLIQGKITPEFIVGNGALDHTMNQGLSTIEPAYAKLTVNSSLSHELWLAAINYPWIYGTVKVLNFWDYLHPRDRYYFQSFMHPNNLNLAFNLRFEAVRNKLFILLHAVYEHPVLKFFSFVHLPWFFVNLIGIALCFVYKRKSDHLKTLGMILFIPAIYYFSFLIALPASDFRYMYPATLVVQIITLGCIFALFEQIRRV